MLEPLRADPPQFTQFVELVQEYAPSDEEEVDDLWEEIRTLALRKRPARAAVARLLAKHPLKKFRQEMVDYITTLKELAPKPFIYQVRGRAQCSILFVRRGLLCTSTGVERHQKRILQAETLAADGRLLG